MKEDEAEPLSRRMALRLAGGAAILGAAVGSGLQAGTAEAAPSQEIVGTWSVINSASGPRVVTYSADGGSVAVQADPVRTAQLGTWVRTGDHQFLVRTLSIRLDGQGNAIGTFDVRLSATVDAALEHYSGPLVQRELDLMGNVVDTTNATVQATRLTTLPL